jgi:hypothetical protein
MAMTKYDRREDDRREDAYNSRGVSPLATVLSGSAHTWTYSTAQFKVTTDPLTGKEQKAIPNVSALS